MEMEFIDSHAHIYLEDFKGEVDEIIRRYKEEKVTKVLLPNIDASTIDQLKGLAKKEVSCQPMMGLHPCYVKENYKDELIKIKRELVNDSYIAVGEIGTDLYWDKSLWKEQKAALIEQVNWSKDLNLPIVLHSRDSIDETIEIISSEQDGSLRGVFHCFTGSAEQARKIIDLGFYMGIGGVLTFKNSGLDKEIMGIGLENMLLETDSPYLSPVPYRGKRNEPSYIIKVAEKLSADFEVSLSEVAEKTTRNTIKLFGL